MPWRSLRRSFCPPPRSLSFLIGLWHRVSFFFGLVIGLSSFSRLHQALGVGGWWIRIRIRDSVVTSAYDIGAEGVLWLGLWLSLGVNVFFFLVTLVSGTGRDTFG